MKSFKWMVPAMALLLANIAHSQGVVNFNNRNFTVSPQINAPISYTPSSGPRCDTVEAKINGAYSLTIGGFNYGGIYARAALYGGPAGTPEDQLVMLGDAVGFRTGTAAGYVNIGTNSLRVVPNVPPGAIAVVQVRVWDAGMTNVNSYEDAKALISPGHASYYGKSPMMHVTLGDTNSPAHLLALPSFQIMAGIGCYTPPSFWTYRITNSLVLNWSPTNGILQAHTSSSMIGLSTNWQTLSSAQPPFVVPLTTTNPAAFYRVKFW